MAAIAELALPQPIEPLFPSPLRERLVALRREIHANPELSFKEVETARRLAAALADVSPVQLDRVAGTGVVARIRGRERGAPVVAVRGDIDALPIEEATGLPFASRNPGVMHACGHDVHTAALVDVARRLAARPPARGAVKLLFQ